MLLRNILVMVGIICSVGVLGASSVKLGVDQVFESPFAQRLQGRQVGLITNRASRNQQGKTTLELFLENQGQGGYKLRALFAPEHGLKADLEAFAFVQDETFQSLPVYSLHGTTKRPTTSMLKPLDLLILDLQTVGTRCYTYETTLFYIMEEAAKAGIELWVLDRPNPLGGERIEGQMLQERFKCFFGYLEIPFIHGMTIGELAHYFKAKKQLHLDLHVLAMSGWHRDMVFDETGLDWFSPSPNILDSQTALIYPATIALGETLEIVNVDKGGAHPFKRLGAPWINAEQFVAAIMKRDCIGVSYQPHTFVPQSGPYAQERCQGILLNITDPKNYRALELQKAITLTLIELYSDPFYEALEKAQKKGRAKACHYLTGNTAFFSALQHPNQYEVLMKVEDEEGLKEFMELRKKCLIY